MKSLTLASLVCVLLSLPAMPQFELGSIVGVITDPSKVAIAGATVEIRSLSTNVKREVITSASGEYNSLPLQPGRYSISVRQQGFREQTLEVTLGVGQRLQFRAEAFNTFNTPQFNNPNASIGFAGVAKITSAGTPTVFQRTSRQIQLALKLYF